MNAIIKMIDNNRGAWVWFPVREIKSGNEAYLTSENGDCYRKSCFKEYKEKSGQTVFVMQYDL